MKSKGLTPEQIKRAVELRDIKPTTSRSRKTSWRRVGKLMGVSERQLSLHFIPGWRERDRIFNRRAKRAMRSLDEQRERVREHIISHRPSADIIAERDRAFSVDLTPNMIVLGDPPPCRSALHQRS